MRVSFSLRAGASGPGPAAAPDGGAAADDIDAARRTSSSVIIPSGPVPLMAARSTPASAAIRFARGDATTREREGAATDGGGADLPATAGCAAGFAAASEEIDSPLRA